MKHPHVNLFEMDWKKAIFFLRVNGGNVGIEVKDENLPSLHEKSESNMVGRFQCLPPVFQSPSENGTANE